MDKSAGVGRNCRACLRFIRSHSVTSGRSTPTSSECDVPYRLQEQNVHHP